MTTPLRLAFVGAGQMGAQHAAAFHDMDDVEITAVVARGSVRGRALADRVGAAFTTDLGDVLRDPCVDAVVVSVATRDHAAVAGAALAAGKHVFCETPLTATAVEAECLLESARAADRHLQVALLARFARPGPELCDTIRDGSLGELRVVTTRRLAPGISGAHHGDVLEELLFFDLDLLRWSLGTPDAVTATAYRGESRLDHAHVALAWGDVHGWCEASYLLPAAEPFEAGTTALFERGALRSTFRASRDGPPTIEVRRTAADGDTIVSNDLGAHPVEAECRHFVDVLRGDADRSLLDASEAIASLRLLDAVRESLATRSTITP